MQDMSAADLIQSFSQAPGAYDEGEEKARLAVDALSNQFAPAEGISVRQSSLGDLNVELAVFDDDGPIVLYFHGGGFVTGSCLSHRHLCSFLAKSVKGVVYSVDYRLAPEDPFPAALEDAVSAYLALVREFPDRAVSIAGDSAGGGLAFSCASYLRDSGEQMPACIVGLSPWVNLCTDSESYELLAELDPLLSAEVADWHSRRYLNGVSAKDPRVSPLFADHSGFPPVLIQIGDREVFLGDAVVMHQKLMQAQVRSVLEIGSGLFHVWHLFWPVLKEARDALTRAGNFILQNSTLKSEPN